MAKEDKIDCVRKAPKTGKIFGRKPKPFDSRAMALEVKSRSTPKDFLTADVFPEVTSTTWRCKRKPAKGTPQKTLRPCHVELAFLGKEIAQKQKVPPGAYLRLCTEWAGEAFLIPVEDHADALTKSREICECHQKRSRKKCAGVFKKRYREVPAMQAKRERKAVEAGKPECLKWSKNKKRCLRRAKE